MSYYTASNDHCRPAAAAAHAANPPLATLAQALRAPLLPMVGFAQLIAHSEASPEIRGWAAEILSNGTSLLGVLDATLALAAGHAPERTSPEALAAAEDAVAALRRLLAAAGPGEDYGVSQRMVA